MRDWRDVVAVAVLLVVLVAQTFLILHLLEENRHLLEENRRLGKEAKACESFMRATRR